MTDAAATAPTTSAPPRGWAAAFEAARAGEVDAARAICAEIARGPSPFAGANEILLGRCLAESGSRLRDSQDRETSA
ncbi:hypothetical protein HY256_10765 [Candidatus Sumerlaeota bacterium]|nr:hypothetical protein [Candidatus Sumerlaeota bacterium]